MFKLWGKIFKDTKLIRDHVECCDHYETSRTERVLSCLDGICREFDLLRPIWLDSNIKDFQRYAKTRFTNDSFIEEQDFDFLEIQVLEE